MDPSGSAPSGKSSISRRDLFRLTLGGGSGLALSGLLDVRAIRAATADMKLSNVSEFTTSCNFCSCGCGMIAAVRDGKLLKMEGDYDHIVNRGSLCVKGISMHATHASPQRLTKPRYRAAGGDQWQEISWDDAIARVAQKIRKTRDENWIATEKVIAPDLSIDRASSPRLETVPHFIVHDAPRDVPVNRTDAIGFMGGAASASINLVIAFFGLYYMLHGSAEAWLRFRDYIPFSPKTADALREHFYSVTRATLLGTALVAAAQGTIIGLGFRIVGLPDALFWGTMTAFVSILPVLGSGLVWIPAVIVLIVQGRYGAAVVLGVISWLVASNIDNLIRPLVYRRVSNIHPMITLVGAFAGIKYFGLPGLLLGPLAIAYFFELLRFYKLEYGTPPDAPSGEGAGPGAPVAEASVA